ncbi:GNAT family N-acetyltransferase [Corynebacterium kozikiae]|uniref:GNAT family N-acetyltransferase n=1 Tax=Corynebacterium kozikiae TaxID=2968469 RepID=UPI00211C81D7|nr:GNAT family N-acetyltransferase [Corynebacterium sp. 76QC2CO]MCQ9343731.1 GNAT family N-acetyltransferase [Corynebacterium sp. 76QC2CO]MCQ9370990.1 GNAT family N-acetyltransferase [Corynebacterium sp. 35RC1]
MDPFFAVSRLADLSPLELHKLYKLRVDVFVAEQQCPYAEIDDHDLTAAHFMAWGTDATLLGCARIFPEGEHVKLGRFVVAPAARGTGLAQELMFQALRYAEEQFPGKRVLIHAQEPLERYYEQYGFTRVGEAFDEDGVPHIPMLK